MDTSASTHPQGEKDRFIATMRTPRTPADAPVYSRKRSNGDMASGLQIFGVGAEETKEFMDFNFGGGSHEAGLPTIFCNNFFQVPLSYYLNHKMPHSSPEKANRHGDADNHGRKGDASLSERQLDLELPIGSSDAEWIGIKDRAPLMHEVLVIKRNAEGWMGMVAGLHNDREIVVMVFQGPGMSELVPMIEDGMDRRAGLTHWRPWPTIPLPSLIAHLV